MKRVDLAYIAGIFDGEGCICLRRAKKKGVALDISVVNTNEWLMQWLKFALGGNFYPVQKEGRRNKNWKPCWRWTISSNRALDCLKLLYPYLRLKKPQAELAIKFQEARRGSGYSLTDEEKAVDEAQKIVMGEFNRRGRPKKIK